MERYVTIKEIAEFLNELSFRYIACGINAPDADIENIKFLKLNNKYGLEIYNDIIKPALSRIRKT